MKKDGKFFIFFSKFFILFFLFLGIDFTLAQSPSDIPRDILIAASVQPWLYFEISPLDLTLSPDLVSSGGEVNIGESEEVILKVGTNNEKGWQIKIKGKNGGLKSEAHGYTISTVFPTSTLIAGREGYGAQATSTLAGAIINSIYDFYGTNTVGEIPKEYRILVIKYSKNSLLEVAKMKIKASASLMTPAGFDYTDEIVLTIIPLV